MPSDEDIQIEPADEFDGPREGYEEVGRFMVHVNEDGSIQMESATPLDQDAEEGWRAVFHSVFHQQLRENIPPTDAFCNLADATLAMIETLLQDDVIKERMQKLSLQDLVPPTIEMSLDPEMQGLGDTKVMVLMEAMLVHPCIVWSAMFDYPGAHPGVIEAHKNREVAVPPAILPPGQQMDIMADSSMYSSKFRELFQKAFATDIASHEAHKAGLHANNGDA